MMSFTNISHNNTITITIMATSPATIHIQQRIPHNTPRCLTPITPIINISLKTPLLIDQTPSLRMEETPLAPSRRLLNKEAAETVKKKSSHCLHSFSLLHSIRPTNLISRLANHSLYIFLFFLPLF